jgi:hypothetical protein
MRWASALVGRKHAAIEDSFDALGRPNSCGHPCGKHTDVQWRSVMRGVAVTIEYHSTVAHDGAR